MVVGHLGINVPDLELARAYYAEVMPLVGFESFLDASGGISLEAPRVFSQYPQPYYATFWFDPFGLKLEAVCHHDA